MLLDSIKPATIQWRDGLPYSESFNDVYFSREGGLAETKYVFIEGNQLTHRFKQSQHITIAETGFGTGLNFLATVDAWQNIAPDSARLSYVAVEKYPLRLNDLHRALAHWPQLQPYLEPLTSVYPPLIHGCHRLRLLNGRVTLTLLLGDAVDMFSQLEARVDAWYLDGFAPSNNTAMWSTDLFTQIARLSHQETSFATFTAAGDVRRGLQAVGFAIEKRPGFGKKREMLCGQFKHVEQKITSSEPWFELTTSKVPVAISNTKEAIVIGAGLAGVSCAHSLARRGWKIQLLESGKQPAQQASGNLAGIVMPRLTADMSREAQFYLSAFLNSIAWFNQLKQRYSHLAWQQSGVLQFGESSRLEQLGQLSLPDEIVHLVDSKQASQLSGIEINRQALHFPMAGWLNPPQLCEILLQDQADKITLTTQATVRSIKGRAGEWQVLLEGQKSLSAAVVIVANSYDASSLIHKELHTDDMGLQRVRGQLTYVNAIEALPLKLPLCEDSYVLPAHEGIHCLGATYDWQSDSQALSDQDHQQNLAGVARQIPSIAKQEVSGGRVAFRASTEDHLPLFGPVPQWDFYGQTYADLRHGQPAYRYPHAQYQQGLYVTTGHGSRGLVSCPFAAEWIAAHLEAEPLPISNNIYKTLHPARFLIRKLKRSR